VIVVIAAAGIGGSLWAAAVTVLIVFGVVTVPATCVAVARRRGTKENGGGYSGP
jgi:hypothetical protein